MFTSKKCYLPYYYLNLVSLLFLLSTSNVMSFGPQYNERKTLMLKIRPNAGLSLSLFHNHQKNSSMKSSSYLFSLHNKSKKFASRLPLTPLRGEANDDDISSSSSSSSSSQSSSLSLVNRFDNFGHSLKPMAIHKSDEIAKANTTKDKYITRLKTYMYFTLFILYRGYRGFFVILPEVFKEVYRKMDDAVESPFLVTESSNNNKKNIAGGKLQTQLTVSILAGVVTATYVIGGMIHMLKRFFGTAKDTNSVRLSLQAAAEEAEINDYRILRITQTQRNKEKKKILSNNSNSDNNKQKKGSSSSSSSSSTTNYYY